MGLKDLLPSALFSFSFMQVWRDTGGAAVSFNAMKNMLFGKALRTVEYPNGLQKTVVLRVENVQQLKASIAKANELQGGADAVKQVYRYDDYFWAEEISSITDVRSLKEFSLILWSPSYVVWLYKCINIFFDSVQIIPPKGVNLKETIATTAVTASPDDESNKYVCQVNAIRFVTQHCSRWKLLYAQQSSSTSTQPQEALLQQDGEEKKSGNKEKNIVEPLNDEELHMVTDLILEFDSYIISLYSNFKNGKLIFAYNYN